jgi:ribosomal protein S18 acetylase RimI-like enzyme
MQETITIRTARLEELAVLAEFWFAMFEEVRNLPVSEFVSDWRERFIDYFSHRILADDVAFFVATEHERIVGTAGAMLDDGYATSIHGLRFGYVFGVRIEPAYRGRGLATALTRETIAFLKSKQCRRIRLHASTAGRPIYERLGFVPTNEMQLMQ